MSEDTPARKARLSLSNRRARTQEDMQQLIERYIVERFLFRLSRSPWRDSFILKGAQLFSLWLDAPHRPTRDIDLASIDSSVDEEHIQNTIAKICTVDAVDGVEFLVESLVTAPIREFSAYPGIRATIQTRLDGARFKLQIDIGFGDAITPGPQTVTVSSLIDTDTASLLGYPMATVIAEKFECIITTGVLNSRMKDYFDLLEIARSFDLVHNDLVDALRATCNRRGTVIPSETPEGLTDAFADAHDKQAQWRGFLRKTGVPNDTSLASCVAEIRDLLMPVAHSVVHGNKSDQRIWLPGSGWTEVGGNTTSRE